MILGVYSLTTVPPPFFLLYSLPTISYFLCICFFLICRTSHFVPEIGAAHSGRSQHFRLVIYLFFLFAGLSRCVSVS